MSKPWGIGAWARAVEEEEREAAAAASATGESQNFPSLKEAVNSKPKKNKKMTLSEFTKSTTGENQGPTPDEMLRLPTGPKERSAEEMEFSRHPRGFSSFDRPVPPMGRRDRDGGGGHGSWGEGRRSYGGFDDERRGPNSRASELNQPSRADEVDSWAVGKKSLPAFDSGRQNRYGSGGGGGFGGSSRADGVDNWTAGKKDRFSRGPSLEMERPRLALDPPTRNEGSMANKPNPFGAARPREEVLAEKGLDWKKLDSEIEAKKPLSRPTSSHSSRPSSAHSQRSEGPEASVPKPRPKVNPFGDAKPREVLLNERGMDWRKIDLELEHRGVDRPETDEEKLLKEEIENLKKELEKESTMNSNKEALDEAGGNQTSTHAMLQEKERELEQLIRDLDDKVRFGQKAVERPGSSAGKGTGFSDRPPSRSGSFEDSRSVDFTDRPRSRGTGDTWTRPSDDRRQFQGSRERGWFSNNRNSNRSTSRERW